MQRVPVVHRYTRERLSASAMARYALAVSGNSDAKKVLWINQPQNGDYLRDNMMVGFRILLGNGLVDVSREDYLYKIPNGARTPMFTHVVTEAS